MFGKKKSKEQIKDKAVELHINTMPSVFYGGQDPEIYHNRDSGDGLPDATSPVISNVKKQVLTTVQPRPLGLPANSDSSKKKKFILWGFCGFFFLILLGAIIWYYTKDFGFDSGNNSAPQKTDTQTNATTPIQPTSTAKEDIPTSTAANIETTSTVEIPPLLSANSNLEFPSIILSDTDDIDSDQLTDKEEEIFETDSGAFDTDKDGYFDGQEVFNLYNPKGIAPRRLIDSGLVKEYTNPFTNYRLYYPLTWQAGEVDTLGRQVLFSNIEGDYIEVRAFDKTVTETFTDWFVREAKGQKITDLITFKNRFKVDGWRRRDDLVLYFVDQNKIYVIIFHPAQIGPVTYRHIMKMLMQSFRYATTVDTLEDQPLVNISETVSTTPNTVSSTIPLDMSSPVLASSTSATST